MIGLGLREPRSAPAEASAGTSPVVPSAADQDALAAALQPVFGNRLELLAPVALGGMATLFQLRHRLHGGLFVAKVLHSQLAREPAVVESFHREMKHAACLGGHPNAIPIFDAGEHNGLHFLLMPFIEGEDLDTLLAHHGALSRAEALHFAAQISSLLSLAESHGITHCDIAPGNIRLDTFGRYRLMDFGISHAVGEAPSRFLAGTPLYSSPEQIRGELPDIRTDLYSLGLVLAEVLSGKPLFTANSLDELKDKHLRGAWQLPPEIQADAPVARLLDRLLATDRTQRLASAFELSGALSALGFERPEFRDKWTSSNAQSPDSPQRRKRLSPE